VYELESLLPGHAFAGPAIVQAAYTTAVIPPGRRFSIESHGLGILEA
jgi:N-methylhydantoinase A/oxoprolinase/acetone carboxylase beta subunit